MSTLAPRDLKRVQNKSKHDPDLLQFVFLLQIPTDPEQMKHWMYNLYAEKEKMLEEYYRSGVFPHGMFPPASTSKKSPDSSERAPRQLHHDPLKFLLLHLFFIVSTSIMYCAYLTIPI